MPVLSSSLAPGKHRLSLAAEIAIQQAEKDQVQNTMEMSLPGLWDCLSLPALLMEPSSQQSPANGDSLHTKPCLLALQRSGLQLGGSPARSDLRAPGGTGLGFTA